MSARIYADFPRGRLRKKLSFPCHVPYIVKVSALVVLLHALTQFSGELRYAYNMIVAFHFQNNLIIVQVFSTVLHTDVCECVCV